MTRRRSGGGRRQVADVALVLRTVQTAMRARSVLSRRGLPGAMSTFDLQPVPQGGAPVADHAWDQRRRHDVKVIGRVLRTRPVRSTCLPTAVTLAAVLESRGLHGDVVIGVSVADGFSAHAWVELPEGRVDLERHPLSTHREITRLRRRVASTEE